MRAFAGCPMDFWPGLLLVYVHVSYYQRFPVVDKGSEKKVVPSLNLCFFEISVVTGSF